MANARGAVATGVGRLVGWGLRTVLHRGASQLPGRCALLIDSQVIAHLRDKLREGSIVVCGTNGKTTTTNIIAATLEASGSEVLCNRDGANMAAGVASAMLPRHNADWAVIEVDELSTIHVLPQLRPRYFVLLNLFRDQLDRAGEIDHVQDVIVEALAGTSETTLVVCGDDPLSVRVAQRAAERGTRVMAFGMGEDLGLIPDRVPEARFCQVCGAELTYAYRSYAQLGCFACPNGDFARPELDFVATEVSADRDGVSFAMSSSAGGHRQVEAGFGGVYMVYNLLAAAAVSQLAGVSDDAFTRALRNYHPHNGRLQSFVVDGREVLLNLAKNPTGFNQNIALMLSDKRPKAAFFIINDNYNDGRDISWIWDVDFERLVLDSGDLPVIAGGDRRADLRVRLKYAGISAPLARSVSEAIERLEPVPRETPLYVFANYSALWPAKAELERMGERRDEQR